MKRRKKVVWIIDCGTLKSIAWESSSRKLDKKKTMKRRKKIRRRKTAWIIDWKTVQPVTVPYKSLPLAIRQMAASVKLDRKFRMAKPRYVKAVCP